MNELFSQLCGLWIKNKIGVLYHREYVKFGDDKVACIIRKIKRQRLLLIW